MEKLGLPQFFAASGEEFDEGSGASEFSVLYKYFPELWRLLGLSLRDMDYCVRMVALVGKQLDPHQLIFPWMLGLLIPLKLINPTLFRQFTQGHCKASDVIDFVDERFAIAQPDGPDSGGVDVERILDIIEGQLYLAESQDVTDPLKTTARKQLQLLLDGKKLTNPEYLSKRMREPDKERIQRLLQPFGSDLMFQYWDKTIDRLAKLVDLHQPTRG